jgi:NADPH:quinone reductase-like Zn-dependent oxidoreductase
VNSFETLLRANRYAVTPELPMILGVEAVGVVEAVGDEVTAPGIAMRVAVPLSQRTTFAAPFAPPDARTYDRARSVNRQQPQPGTSERLCGAAP